LSRNSGPTASEVSGHRREVKTNFDFQRDFAETKAEIGVAQTTKNLN
jgi:hypothetical protein